MTKELITRRKWQSAGPFNSVLNGDDFFISYNPGDSGVLIDGSETALVKGNEFCILNGDWREDYEQIIDQGYEVCKKFFDRNNIGNNVNFWSN